jgi:spermidine/putrescine transport system ATP-binding protein
VNIFDADVLRIENEKMITVNIMNNERSVPTVRSFTPKEKVHVVVRPEDLRVWGESEITDTEGMYAGVVEEVIYKGTTVDLSVRLKNNKLISATEFFNEDDDRLEYKRGEQVWVNWTPGWEVVLPYET